MILKTTSDTEIQCPECDGAGTVSCDCDCCSGEHRCEICNSTGMVRFGSLKQADQSACFSLTQYKEAMLDDVRNLANWMGKNPKESLASCGYSIAESTKLYWQEYPKRKIIRTVYQFCIDGPQGFHVEFERMQF